MDLDDVLYEGLSVQKGRYEGGGTKKYLFEIDLGVGGHPSVADEVDDPFLAFIRGKVETGRKVALWKNEG